MVVFPCIYLEFIVSLSAIIFKIVSGASLLVGGFVASHFWYFKAVPLWGVPFLGQTLTAFLTSAVGLYVVPYLLTNIIRALKRWLTAIISSSVSKAVGSFMASQAGRFKEGKVNRREALGHRDQRLMPNDLVPSPSAVPMVILDTSAIIDGRIVEIIKLGFLDSTVVVPRFVLSELQTLADSSDDLKRGKGRRGLELLESLKSQIAQRFSLVDEEVKGKDVDEKILRLAKKMAAKVATVDYNLNKTASVVGVEVLNVNDLANSIKTPLVPGDRATIKIVHEGKDSLQGVGYLEDGTMIVVEGGKDFLGQKIEVEVSRFLQTSAGKMIFAKHIQT